MCKGCGASDYEVYTYSKYVELVCNYCKRKEIVFVATSTPSQEDYIPSPILDFITQANSYLGAYRSAKQSHAYKDKTIIPMVNLDAA